MTNAILGIDANTQKFKHIPKKILYNDSAFSLLIRPLIENDAETVHNTVMHSVNDLRPFMDWSHNELSVKGQFDRIGRSIKAYQFCIEFDFAVFDHVTGKFVMSASLSAPQTPNKTALGVGYWVSSEYSGKGIATILTKILLILAFDVLCCSRIEIGCNKANLKSLNVIKKCGFIFEGEARNYFSEATPEMILNGCDQERTCLKFALIPEDVKGLSWYAEIKEKILVVL